MLASSIILAAAGAALGALGGWAGKIAFAALTGNRSTDENASTRGYWRRPPIVGLLASCPIAFPSAFDMVPSANVTVLAVLAAGSVAAAVYVVVWLKTVTSLGVGAVEAGELSLAITLIVVALLYVSGALWMTLLVLGCVVLAALTVVNGMWLYKIR